MRGYAWMLLLVPTVVHGASVTVAWDPAPPTDVVTGWKVYYDTDSGPPYSGTFANEGPSPIDVPVASLPDANAPQVRLSGIDSCTQVYFAATAYNDSAESDYSTEISFIVANKPTLQVLRGGANTLSLVWDDLPPDDNGAIAGYHIWYDTSSSPDTGAWPPVYGGTGATEGDSGFGVSVATTSLLLHALTAATTYYLRVSTYCANGGERWSAEGSGTPGACGGDPDCDDNLSCNGSETCTIASGQCLPGTPRCASPDALWCTTTCDESNVGCNLLDPLRCLISGVCARAGSLRPAEPCQECVSAVSTVDWSADDSNHCDDGDACTSNDYCQSAVCQPGTDICVDGGVPDAAANDAAATDGASQDTAEIDGGASDAASDAAVEPDASLTDAAGQDATLPDAGRRDRAGTDRPPRDRAVADQAAPDVSGNDSATGDSAVVDGARPDTVGRDVVAVDTSGRDAATAAADGNAAVEVGSGCTCRSGQGPLPISAVVVAGLIGLAWWSRRRR